MSSMESDDEMPFPTQTEEKAVGAMRSKSQIVTSASCTNLTNWGHLKAAIEDARTEGLPRTICEDLTQTEDMVKWFKHVHNCTQLHFMIYNYHHY